MRSADMEISYLTLDINQLENSRNDTEQILRFKDENGLNFIGVLDLSLAN